MMIVTCLKRTVRAANLIGAFVCLMMASKTSMGMLSLQICFLHATNSPPWPVDLIEVLCVSSGLVQLTLYCWALHTLSTIDLSLWDSTQQMTSAPLENKVSRAVRLSDVILARKHLNTEVDDMVPVILLCGMLLPSYCSWSSQ